MHRILAVLCVCLTSGCAAVPENYWQVSRKVSERFTYVTDIKKHGLQHYDEPGVTGESRFTGDCEEAASAMQYQLAKIGVPSKRWVVATANGFHAITCTFDNWCLDANALPTRRENIKGAFVVEMP